MRFEDAEALRDLVLARSGVVINAGNAYQIESQLGPVARREGAKSVSDLIGMLRDRPDERLIWAVTEAMLDGETAFFRDFEVFEQFRTGILPRLPRDRPARIWSAGCASGQEAYSLAMILQEESATLGSARIDLFASDLSESLLCKAQTGLYTQFEAQRGMPIRKLLGHFGKDGEAWRVSPELARAVRWRRINLLSDLSPLGRFDVIFCRYVVGQFDAATRRRVLRQLSRLLNDDGYLVLGMDETAEDIDGVRAQSGTPGVYARTPPDEAAAA